MTAPPTRAGSVAVVTGAGRGMGREVARRLVDRGWHVVGTDVDAEAVRRAAADLGGDYTPVQHDVRDPQQHRLVARQAAALGPLVAWINNAGVLRTGTLWDQDDATVSNTVDVNLMGVVHGTRAALDVMREHGQPADIVNMASMSAFGPVPGLAAYAASKAAVLSWTMSTAAELRAARCPVRMHAVCPDGVRTDMVAENAGDSGSAMIFSAGLLDPGAVADEVVALIGSRRILRSLPRRRAAMARISGVAPAALLPLVERTTKAGDRRRRRAAVQRRPRTDE